jgi:type IV pilus assembly protein PilY1
MYYDPNVDYNPWPTLSNANPDLPRSHPMHAGDTLNLSGIYEVRGGIDVDNLDGGPTFTTPTGGWGESGASPEFNGSSYFSSDAGATAVWTPNLPVAGTYGVFIYWASGDGWDRDASAQYTIHDTMGDHVFVRDQRVNYGQWNLMGTFNFAAGTSGYVRLTRGAGGATSADAVKFVNMSSGANVIIRNAHYYVWSASDSKPYLVIIDGGSITYYEVNDDGDDLVETGELTLTASPPADVVTGRGYAAERQNFANWYSFYRKRELTATAAVANVIHSMQGVQIGLRGINGYDSDLIQPVHKIKVGGVDETITLLNKLYGFDNQAYGTPLRRGLESVGRYFHQNDSHDGGIGASPYATVADGGECQHAFAIVMTDGYWNGDPPYTSSIANNDGDGSSAYDGAAPHGDEPYGDGYDDTLADVAMYYYENDLSSTLGPEVPTNPWDDNPQQHMVTYGVSFGVTGTLNPNDYDSDLKEIAAPHDYVVWPNPTAGDKQKIDDLWHASVNGRGFFLSASNPNELVNSLLEIMKNIEEREGSASSVSVNGDELYTKLSGGGEILMFQSSYDTENWTGDVKAYQVCTELTGNCAGKTVGDIIRSPYVWSANEELGSINWNTGRRIVTYNGTNAGTPFRWGDLTATQKGFLNNDSTLLDYLRGDTTNEVANGGSFRDRFAKLGDMVHSSPTFEDGVLYAGGNDGMLHAFAAADDEPYAGAVGGEELFAYVPNFVFENLSQLADPTYTHKYFVDLTPTVKAGVDLSGVSTTVLVGGLGKGGRGYYALDVTDPASWTSESAIDDKVMWEYPKASVTDNDMGYSFSKPAIVKCNDPTVGWIVIFGNGYNSQNGHAVLYILNPETGDVIKKIDTQVDGCNGLSTPVPIDVNYDNKVDYVYAGDLRGNMWKFDLTNTDYNNWEVAFNDGANDQPLIQAQGPGGTTQPITAKPDVMYHPTEHGYMVFFSTGQYLGESDISETTAQSFYGIWDYGDDADDREYLGSFNRGFDHELSNQPTTVTLLAQGVIPSESPDPNAPDFWTVTVNEGQPDEYDLLLRLTTDHEIVWETVDDPDAIQSPPEFLPDLSDTNDNHAGWYFDLPLSGERGNVDMMIRGGVLIAISFIPEDSPCGYGGDSVIHEMSAASGARLTVPQFDINGDGVIDDNDMINIGTDANPIWVAPTGMSKAGQLQPPAILIDPERGIEIKYFSSSSGDIETVTEKPPLLGISHWREFE